MIPEEGKRRMWSVTQEIDKFYQKLWRQHNSAALSCKDDEVALRVINAIDDAMVDEPDWGGSISENMHGNVTKGGGSMHIVMLIISILCFIVGGLNLFGAAKEWPTKSEYRGIPDGRYTTTMDYLNDKMEVKDTYGNVKITYRRVEPRS